MSRAQLVVAILLVSATAFGQEHKEPKKKTKPPFALKKEVVVTATRTETDLAKVSAFVTVIRPEDCTIKPRTAADLVENVPGLSLTRYGPGLSVSTPMIRGSASTQVLVMIDGVRLNSARGEGVDLADIPAEIIDRIEVVRGGASALWGTDAMGGVINIITKRTARRPTTKLSFSAGSFETYQGRIGRSGPLGTADYGVWLQYEQSRGDFAYEYHNDEKRRCKNSGYNAKSIYIRGGYRLDKKAKISITHIFFDADKGVPGRIEFPTPKARQQNRRNLTTISIAGTDVGLTGLSASLRLNYKTEWLSYYDPIFVGEHPTGYNDAAGGAELLASYPILRHQLATFSVSARSETLDSKTSGKHSRTTASIFVQDTISLLDDRLIILPAARYDRYSDMGRSFNPKIGIRLKPLNLFSIKANASTSYRVPGFDDLYWPTTGFAAGNPDLHPERCKSFDAGITLNLGGRVRLETAYFRNVAKELIQWQPGRGGRWSPTNIGRALFQGVESSLNVAAADWLSLELSHTSLDARDISEPSNGRLKLIRRPRNKLLLRIRLGSNRFNTSLQATWTDKRFTNLANTRWLPAYTLLDLGLLLRPLSWLTAQLSIKNLLDTSYQLVPGYAMPGRNFSVTISTRFERW